MKTEINAAAATKAATKAAKAAATKAAAAATKAAAAAADKAAATKAADKAAKAAATKTSIDKIAAAAAKAATKAAAKAAADKAAADKAAAATKAAADKAAADKAAAAAADKAAADAITAAAKAEQQRLENAKTDINATLCGNLENLFNSRPLHVPQLAENLCITSRDSKKKIQESALELLKALGFYSGCSIEVAEKAVKDSKKAVKLALLGLYPAFSAGDGSRGDKEYKSLCSALQNMTRFERDGLVIPVREKVKKAVEKVGSVAAIVRENTAVELYEGEQYNSDVISFEGTIETLVSDYELEIFACIKGNAELLKAFLLF